MWLELVGFSHGETAALMTLFKVATSLGALFGGKMGDALARWFTNSGRTVLSQISSGSAIPLAGVLLLALPNDPSVGSQNRQSPRPTSLTGPVRPVCACVIRV